MLSEMNGWHRKTKASFLAVLAHEITVCARSTYEVGSDDVSNTKLLRSYNELQHRITASLRDYQFDNEGIPLSVILTMLSEFGARHARKSDIELAVSRAYQLATAANP